MSEPAASGRIVAVVQARTGSSRFPEKMLARLSGRPLLYHVLARAQRLRQAQAVFLATTTAQRDDRLADLAREMGCGVVRGPEEDVLARFLLAVEVTRAAYVVRICGDAPLFDPDLMDAMALAVRKADADVAVLDAPGPSAYQGADVISARALRWMGRTAGDDPRAREHVTAYAYAHLTELKHVVVPHDPELLGEFHLSIDTPGDLEALRPLYRRLYVAGGIVDLREAVRLMRELPKGKGGGARGS